MTTYSGNYSLKGIDLRYNVIANDGKEDEALYNQLYEPKPGDDVSITAHYSNHRYVFRNGKFKLYGNGTPELYRYPHPEFNKAKCSEDYENLIKKLQAGLQSHTDGVNARLPEELEAILRKAAGPELAAAKYRNINREA